jgi:hypothetical protein
MKHADGRVIPVWQRIVVTILKRAVVIQPGFHSQKIQAERFPDVMGR